MAADSSRPSRLGTVRVRTTVGSTAIVGIALLAGSLLLLSLTRRTLTNEVTAVTRLRAVEIARAIESTDGAELPVLDREDELIQIRGPDGVVVARSPELPAQTQLPEISEGTARQLEVDFDDDPFLGVTSRARTSEGDFPVTVAYSLDEVSDSVSVVRRLLAFGLPLLLAIVALILWKVVGRALAPVEGIRKEVDRISSTELQRRVPVPAGNDEISRLANTMNSMLGRLEDSQVRQRQFLSDASHELRSPLASIRQHVEVAIKHPEVVPTGQLAETVGEETTRMQALVEDLFALSKADERQLVAKRVEVDLDDLVFEEAARLRGGEGVDVDTSGVSAARVMGDPDQLRRTIANVASNARRHARSAVVFRLAELDGTALITVDDDGSGIPADQRSRIFERFVRLDGARAREEGGAGLGLAIVAAIVEAHGGTVAAAESPSGGARIEIRLPAVDAS